MRMQPVSFGFECLGLGVAGRQLICYREGRLSLSLFTALAANRLLFGGCRLLPALSICSLALSFSHAQFNCILCCLCRDLACDVPAVTVECHINEHEKLAKLECSVVATHDLDNRDDFIYQCWLFLSEYGVMRH